MTYRYITATLSVTTLALVACTSDTVDPYESLGSPTGISSGDGDATTGDGDAGDGDGDGAPGDGDGAPGDGDGAPGDGDGAPGDGDGAPGAGCMGAEAPAGVLTVGMPFSHWGGGFDLEGNMVDYCEMAGTPFMLVISGAWCGPCNDLAAGLAGLQNSSFFDSLAPIRAAMDAGTFGVVEVLLDNFSDFGPVSVADLQSWETMYNNPNVMLIGDPTLGTEGTEPLWIYLGPVHMGALPAGVLVDADFNLEATGLSESIALATSKYAP